MAKAELYTKEAVLNYYTASPYTMYRVYVGYVPTRTGCRYEYLDSDKNEGEGRLSDALDAIENNKMNSNVYCLELIKEIETRQAKSKEISKEIAAVCIAFQINLPNGVNSMEKTNVGSVPVNIYTPNTPATNMDFSERLFAMMQKQNELIQDRLDQLETQINEQKQIGNIDEDPEENTEEDPTPAEKSGADKVLGALAGILERDEVKSAAAAIIMGLASKFLPKE